MPSYQTCNPRAVTNPLRSMQLFRPAAAVFHTRTAMQDAETALFIARRDLPRAETFMMTARAALGRANQARASVRRGRQSNAMRQLNQARAELRAARKALGAAERGLLAIADDLFQGAA